MYVSKTLFLLSELILLRFLKGDNILIVDSNGKDCARGLTSFSADEIDKVKGLKSDQIEKVLGYSSKSEIVHKDDMVKLLWKII